MKQALFRADIPAAAQILVAREEGNRRRNSTDHIEKIWKIAFDNGALAGKISGAGGGGFIILIVPPERRVNILRALNDTGAHSGGVQFTSLGVESWTLPSKKV